MFSYSLLRWHTTAAQLNLHNLPRSGLIYLFIYTCICNGSKEEQQRHSSTHSRTVPTTVGVSRYKVPGSGCPEGDPGPENVAYASMCSRYAFDEGRGR